MLSATTSATDEARKNRLKKAKKFLNKVKHPVEPGTLWFFSDEKNFCQGQLQNAQDNRWLAVSPLEVPRVMKTKFSQTVMVLGCVSSDVDVMSPTSLKETVHLRKIRIF